MKAHPPRIEVGTPLLQAEGLVKTYETRQGSLAVLQGADLRLNAGETFAIVGMSGAGKSTLLHILGGLDRPQAGRVWIQNENLYRLSAAQRSRLRATRIGFVFQSYHLLPEMDVLENVTIAAMAGSSWSTSAAARRRALDLLAAVGLEDRADHTPAELSGGEQQRVALARALLNDPPLLLADEPTGNLDETTGGQVLERLFSVTRDRGHALLLVTHDERVAATCDRMARLLNGKLVEGAT
jgi:predicted ABC-type transport system involved in lysophospholipase L1 biosynthesis ATPase subunit